MSRRIALSCRRRRGILLAALLLLLFGSIHSAAGASAASLRGIVLDEDRSPVEGAAVSAWLGRELSASGSTRADGRFDLEVEPGSLYAVYILADDNVTAGIDYLPSQAEAEPDGDELEFTLAPAASLVIEGDLQFVESEEMPLSVVYSVLDPDTGGIMEISGLPLVYGSGPESQSSFLGLDPSHLIVPAGVPFSVMVNSSILVRSDLVPRSFKADEPGHFQLMRGDQVAVDVRRYLIPFNIEVVEAHQEMAESRINAMESVGFYLAAERGTTASALRLISEARNLYEGGKYIESFDTAKRGYIALRQTLSNLAGLYGDAALSVYILISFLAFASTAIAFLLSNRDATKLVGSATVYAVTLVVLYLTYPGSVIIPLKAFAGSAALALAASLTAAVLLPRLLRGRGGNGHVPVRNIVVPIFSIAKRSIRRRRLRFTLTLTSITVLVMSFVALTSFSQGYGLIINRVSRRVSPVNGVLLRAPGYTEMEPAFMTQADLGSGWLERQPEAKTVSPKAENTPIAQPVTKLNGAPIFGVVGFDPAIEPSIIGLEGVLEGGELPSEGEVLISEVLRGELGVEVGEELMLSGTRVTLKGVFDDAAFHRLRDLDGSTYLPKKLENISPEGEPANFILVPCDPSEIVVAHLSTALRIPFVGIARVDIAVEEGVDAIAFAERLALERGYMAWSSSADGVHLAQLGSYLEGKGLPLVVPWGIVVLNVVVTMLNSMYERRREIHILSSVGLNPAQIAAIFFAEASIIGVTAGGVGYLAGLSLYKAMAFFRLALEVHQKVSALWSLAAIGVAMTAVLIGTLAALKSSVVITPSLMRRWRIEERPTEFTAPWELSIPVRLLPEEVEAFVGFVLQALRAREGDPVRRTSSIRVSTDAEGALRRVNFVYRATQSTAGNFYTKNILLVERRPDEAEASVRLMSYGEQDWAHISGTMVRMLAMQWSTLRGSVRGSRSS